MSRKSAAIAALVEQHRGKPLNCHYLAFFDCFNRQLFFEAHDVLEELWLADRSSPNHLFYKGLIQLAGAFVHLQKGRLKPAAALFGLARSNLSRYPDLHEDLDVRAVLQLVENWLGRLEAGGYVANPLEPGTAPVILLRR